MSHGRFGEGGLKTRLQRILPASYLKGQKTDRTPNVFQRDFIVLPRKISKVQKIHTLYMNYTTSVGDLSEKMFGFFFFVLPTR